MPQICRQYASRGGCTRGTNCRFIHQRSSDSENPPRVPISNTPATPNSITSRSSIPEICRQYASTGSCKRGTRCKFVHPCSSEKPPPDTNAPASNPITLDASPTTVPYPDSSGKVFSGFGDSRDVNVLLTRVAELEEELATAREARLEAEREAEEAREAQLEAERGEVEAIHAHQDAEGRADQALQVMQASESRLNQAVQAQEATELKAKGAENKMHDAVKARKAAELKLKEAEGRADRALRAMQASESNWKAAELKSKEAENKMSLEVRARHTAEIRAKDAEARVDDATKARKEAELAVRTAVQRELQAIEEAKSAKRAQAEAEAKVKVSSAQVVRTLPPAIINPAPTPNTDAFLAWKSAQSACKEQTSTIQRIVSGSTLVTFGRGLEVQSVICGFDNGLIEVKDIPYQATMGEITSLFTAINTRFCVVDIRQYDHSSIIATITVREDIKQQVADAITGKSIRSQVVTAKALKRMVGYAAPRHHTVVLRANPGISVSFQDALERRLLSAPGLMSFQFPPHSAYRSRMAVTAWFNSEAAANQARNSLHLQSLTSDRIILECDNFWARQKSVKHALVVSLEHYDLHGTGKTIPKYGEMSASLEAEELTIQTKNLGYEWFNGWQWFDDAATKTFFASKLMQHSILIKWDCIVRTLTMYTDSEQSMRQVSALLESFTTQSKKAVFYQTIDIYTAKSLAQSKQLEKLATKIGEDEVSLEVLRSRPVIRYKGGQSFFAVRRLMEDIEMNQRTKKETKERCTVCRLKVSPSASIVLICGHRYCIPCLKRCILTAAEQNCLPIVCAGDNAACKQPIAILIIQSLFSLPEFQKLVELIAQSYFQCSDQFRYCITPHCTQVYRRSKEPNYISCSSCNATLCSSCHSKSHSYLSCDDWRILNDQLSQGNKNEAQTTVTALLSKDFELAQCLQAQEIAESGSDATTSESTGGCIVM